MNNEKEKDKKNKGRFLSPSFRKGVVKEKKKMKMMEDLKLT